MSTQNTFQGKTAAEWRAMAVSNRQRSAESFERCDTDGFLSQWAGDQMAARYEQCATIAEDGGMECTAIFDLEGNWIDARLVDTQYGLSWVHEDENGNTKWFNESQARNEKTRIANNAKKGYYVGEALFEAELNNSSGIPFTLRDQAPLAIIDNGH